MVSRRRQVVPDIMNGGEVTRRGLITSWSECTENEREKKCLPLESSTM